MSVWIVVGGQYGSEGKGKISALITLQEGIDICIRCGGPNSGHSFQLPNGDMVLLRQLPTGFVRPETRLLIPAGALVDPDVLRTEIDSLSIDERRVGVDRNTMIITAADREHEQQIGLAERLSSTLCGVGSAVARRALRSDDVRLAESYVAQHAWLRPFITDVSAEANAASDAGKKVLIEGTQGSGLSVYHSRFYPKATSRETNAAGFLSEVGMSPRLVREIVLVFRTFPIRVAGSQAGPLNDEISWTELTKQSGSPISLAEFTSVTHRLRRVGKFEWDEAYRAAKLNRPTRVAINFLDYLNFRNRHVTERKALGPETLEFIARLRTVCRAPISYLGTGPMLSDTIMYDDVSERKLCSDAEPMKSFMAQ